MELKVDGKVAKVAIYGAVSLVTFTDGTRIEFNTSTLENISQYYRFASNAEGVAVAR